MTGRIRTGVFILPDASSSATTTASTSGRGLDRLRRRGLVAWRGLAGAMCGCGVGGVGSSSGTAGGGASCGCRDMRFGIGLDKRSTTARRIVERTDRGPGRKGSDRVIWIVVGQSLRLGGLRQGVGVRSWAHGV